MELPHITASDDEIEAYSRRRKLDRYQRAYVELEGAVHPGQFQTAEIDFTTSPPRVTRVPLPSPPTQEPSP